MVGIRVTRTHRPDRKHRYLHHLQQCSLSMKVRRVSWLYSQRWQDGERSTNRSMDASGANITGLRAKNCPCSRISHRLTQHALLSSRITRADHKICHRVVPAITTVSRETKTAAASTLTAIDRLSNSRQSHLHDACNNKHAHRLRQAAK
jgi:hypothetical protein